MGECGCGNFSGGPKFPGPPGITYVLELKPGCDDCGTPAGVVLHRFKETVAGLWTQGCPDVEWNHFGNDLDAAEMAELALAVFDYAKAIARLKKAMGGVTVGAAGEFDRVEDLIDDTAQEALFESVHDTFRDYARVREQLRPRGGG